MEARGISRAKTEKPICDTWEELAMPGVTLSCVRGERLVVVSPGCRNTGPGPDYSGAVIVLNGQLIVGAVEIHTVESDWFAHNHHLDPLYDTVVLHVVGRCSSRLDPGIPTVTLHELTRCHPPIDSAGDHIGAISAGLVSHLSWDRLIRRSTEILQLETQLSIEDRIRRSFVRKFFDVLGYSANRVQMSTVAEVLLKDEKALSASTFDQTIARIFHASGIPAHRYAPIANSFMSAERIGRIVDATGLPNANVTWRGGARPANWPERRLWGAGKIMFDVYHNRLIENVFQQLQRPNGVRNILLLISPRFGAETFIGPDRAQDAYLNCVLPVALAAGILREDPLLVKLACVSYRSAPSLSSNTVLRKVERTYCGGMPIKGGFWQQGAIELHRRNRAGSEFAAVGETEFRYSTPHRKMPDRPQLMVGETAFRYRTSAMLVSRTVR